jgi:NAD dependent epimerase/dehydratase family enzyme
VGVLAVGAILASQRVIPERLKELGFTWKYPDLDGALRHLLSK